MRLILLAQTSSIFCDFQATLCNERINKKSKERKKFALHNTLQNIFSRSTRQDFENLLNNKNFDPTHPPLPIATCISFHRCNLSHCFEK